ncbi:PTS sugar transporter subunit IIA, partial [Solobacterium sp.]|uniref:PTS sugar transporter subunit IIA n=1 Tax=Solobacterium sp. TaxID=2060878 RepID=UPI0025F1697E
LPALAFDIAIPHTFAEHVNEEAMGVAVLKNPVPFKQMGSPEIELKPRILFMLAIINPKNQLNMLKKIVEIIQDNSALEKIKVAKSEDEIFDVLSSIISE